MSDWSIVFFHVYPTHVGHNVGPRSKLWEVVREGPREVPGRGPGGFPGVCGVQVSALRLDSWSMVGPRIFFGRKNIFGRFRPRGLGTAGWNDSKDLGAPLDPPRAIDSNRIFSYLPRFVGLL